MPFGPLVTLMLLVYLLFLGVVMTFWFILSPGRKADAREDRERAQPQQRERLTRAEERSYRRSAGDYAPYRDSERGANREAEAGRGGSESRDRERAPASTATSKKRKNDAFEDFIRSKNDDFEF